MANNWRTASFTVRRPGGAAWESGLPTLAAARVSCQAAERATGPGVAVYAEQIGPDGETRSVFIPALESTRELADRGVNVETNTGEG